MELYKLNLPNGVVNNIIEQNYDEEECDYCCIWKCNKEMFNCLCKKNIRKKRNVEEDVLAFITVYDKDLSPLIYVKQFMRISEKRYDVLRKILWKLAYEDVEDVKEYIKSYIESKKNVKNTVRDLNIIVKLTYDLNQKMNTRWQLNYYPEIEV